MKISQKKKTRGEEGTVEEDCPPGPFVKNHFIRKCHKANSNYQVRKGISRKFDRKKNITIQEKKVEPQGRNEYWRWDRPKKNGSRQLRRGR